MMDPFPHSGSKSRGAICSITAIYMFPGEAHARTHAVSFAELYGAKRWLELMMGNEDAVRRGNELVLQPSNIKLRSFEFDRILGYSYRNEEEATYRLPDQYLRWIARFRRGTWHETEVITTTTTTEEIKPRVKREVKAKRPGRPEGYVTVGELVKGTSIAPPDARALLRASGLEKPEFGWAFSPNELKKIRRIIGL